jgi:hypothetical protein
MSKVRSGNLFRRMRHWNGSGVTFDLADEAAEKSNARSLTP